MGTIAIDSFNDTGGTLLTAHTACTSGTHTAGLTWARTGYSDATPGTLQIRSTQGVRNTAKSQNVINYASPTPGNADQTVDIEFTLPTSHNYAPGDIIDCWCRGLTGATQTRYAAQWVGNNSGGFLSFTLRKVVSGTNTNLYSANWTFSSFPATSWMRVSAVGTTIRFTMGAAQTNLNPANSPSLDSGNVTDSAISAANNVGIQEELGSPSTASDADAPFIVYFESSDTSTGVSALFRRTLSPFGARSGSRQAT